MYKAVVFFDLDGTLLDSTKHVQASTLNALTSLRDNHVLPVISTGRNLLMISDIMRVTGVKTVICSNGSYIQYHHKVLNTITIPNAILQKLSLMTIKHQDAISFQTQHQVVLNQSTPLTVANYEHFNVDPPIQANFYQNHPINFVNLFTDKLDRYYINQFKGELHIVRNSPYCLDVMKSGVSKQLGVQILLKKLHLENVPTYAFGDGMNDINMFNEVDYSVAMGNALAPCKANGSFITDTNNRNGIAKGLKHYALI
ncbi:Cof-type HAD-IIB family hydrolase [Acetilactobacillus jinshanensis]|uniref:Cof-type HAD-IIB family hydrolase n=1 Tax=Acetilactobacillus jinshanensis TaxID=1720083 RepID=A0A4V1ALQ7_9LACO|nr:Cof-type HAD-IIB family hydrolase [Acetilactobacillus jinshanensis]QBP18439.1 Cof-type HAD-IIB family hydrolase [Acetilactobacillus jinshanensis]URL61311.1 Cof-type HAD-IIB family hydrolase [uncultured bacterium]